MFQVYRKRGILPWEFDELEDSKKILLTAFTLKELELDNKNSICPLMGGGTNG